MPSRQGVEHEVEHEVFAVCCRIVVLRVRSGRDKVFER